MRIGNRRGPDDEPHIDLVPLIDVILVLIIFFVVTATFDARSVLQLELPVANQQQDAPPPRSLGILINAQGRYFVNDQEVLRTDVESLKQALLQLAGDDRQQTVLLRADARTPYQAVVSAQDALSQLGFRRIEIATAPDVVP